MIKSMTAFASSKGSHESFSWAWELRSVNGKGLDLRLRLPDGIDGLEAALRSRLSAALDRGNVSLNLKLSREDTAGALSVNTTQLEGALDALKQVEDRAMALGLSLAPSTPTDLLSIRGILETRSAESDTELLRDTLMQDFEAVLTDFIEMRRTEGQALHKILTSQLAEIGQLVEQAAEAAEARRPEAEAAFRASVARLTAEAQTVDEGRLAQELALLAVKADVTEEIDRLLAHVEAARGLLGQGSPIGRKFDFLAQEFNREANTLCSKSQNVALTELGLALKSVIDQMREQVQNIE